MLPDDSLEMAAECLKILAHPTRLKIVMLLLKDSSNVGTLAEKCDIASHVASEHLRLMERGGFLSSHREGKFVIYSIAEPHLQNFVDCIEARFG